MRRLINWFFPRPIMFDEVEKYILISFQIRIFGERASVEYVIEATKKQFDITTGAAITALLRLQREGMLTPCDIDHEHYSTTVLTLAC